MDPDHVQRLAEMRTPLPAIVVQRSTMRVIDGMHRLRAAEISGKDHIEVRYFDGNDEDAFVLAVELNAAHGLPLSSADRAAAAARVLASHAEWSDQAIASIAGISDKTVAALRQRSIPEHPGLNYRIGRDGRRRPVNPEEGRLRASEILAENFDTPLREVAAKAGISVNTARDVRERLRRGEKPVPEQRRGPGSAAKQRDLLDADTEHTETPAQPAEPDDALGLTPDWKSKLEVLARDPTLRFNEEGRAILRLLHAQMIGAQAWEQFIENVPPHSISVVAEFARKCAESWHQFARRLESRESDAA